MWILGLQVGDLEQPPVPKWPVYLKTGLKKGESFSRYLEFTLDSAPHYTLDFCTN